MTIHWVQSCHGNLSGVASPFPLPLLFKCAYNYLYLSDNQHRIEYLSRVPKAIHLYILTDNYHSTINSFVVLNTGCLKVWQILPWSKIHLGSSLDEVRDLSPMVPGSLLWLMVSGTTKKLIPWYHVRTMFPWKPSILKPRMMWPAKTTHETCRL